MKTRISTSLWLRHHFGNIKFKEGNNIKGMFKQTYKRPLLSLALAVALVIFISPMAKAASGGNGLRISPVRSDLVVSPGQKKTMYVSVTNVTSSPADLQAVINDFVGSPDESGNPAIIFDDTKAASSHSLKKFVAPIPSFKLNPGEQKSVQVNISVPKDAQGGGYFGAVRFAPASSDPNAKTVNLASSVGSIVLLKVPGEIKEQLTIASFDVRHNDSPSSFFTSNKDLTATVRFQNQGNIQEAPFGKVLVKNRSGKVVYTADLNNTTPPGNVLPDSIRKFPLPLKNIGTFGKYKVEGNFGYGATGKLLTASTTFYVIPISYIIAFICVVALLVFLVFGLPKIIRAYNQRVIRNSRRS